jgi:enoyl-CoA hydratase
VPAAELRDETARIAARLAELPGLGASLTKRAINHVEDLRGKRTSMDAVFHMHHFAHAQNALLSGDAMGGHTAKTFAEATRAADKADREG